MMLILYIYKRVSSRKKSFNLTFRHIDNVPSLNNPKFKEYIYPEELEIKDTTDAPKWANYLDRRLMRMVNLGQFSIIK